MVAVALALASCSSAAPSVPAASRSPTPTEVATPVPDIGLFTSQASGPPAQVIRSTDTTDGVSVSDIGFENGRGGQTDAYLVAPEAGGGGAAILWFHWLETGAPTSNRTEFLDEATSLARQGVVSLLVQGTLPWTTPPASVSADSAGVEAEVVMVHRGLDLLRARPDVDAARIALVGHDFGAMYAAVAAGSDTSVAALAMMAPTARWADWFARYWQVQEPADAYAAGMAPLDPVTWLPEVAGRPSLLQVGTLDQYVPQRVVGALTAAIGPGNDVRSYDAGHELNEAARGERDAWLAQVLGLSPAG
jgi:predicted esterase